jgi:hypothetical protein
MTLDHPDGTEGYLEVAALALELAVEPIGGPGKYRRAQRQELAVDEMRQQRVYATWTTSRRNSSIGVPK